MGLAPVIPQDSHLSHRDEDAVESEEKRPHGRPRVGAREAGDVAGSGGAQTGSVMDLLTSHFSYDRSRDGRLYELSEDHKRSLSIGQTGRRHSEETRARIADGNRRRPRDPEADRKRSEKQKGRTFTDEQRLKMSLAKKGKRRPLSDECRRKISERARARVYSPEARKRFSEAAKRRAQRPEGPEGPLRAATATT